MQSLSDRIDHALVREGVGGGLISWKCPKCSSSNKAKNKYCRCGARIPKDVRRK